MRTIRAYIEVPVRVPVTIEFREDDGPERLIIDCRAELDAEWTDACQPVSTEIKDVLDAAALAVSEADPAMLSEAVGDALLPGGRRR